MSSYTIHGVLAGAYKAGRTNLAITLTHASLDHGWTSLCGKVKAGNLCDQEEPVLTCKACLRKVVHLSRPPL